MSQGLILGGFVVFGSEQSLDCSFHPPFTVFVTLGMTCEQVF